MSTELLVITYESGLEEVHLPTIETLMHIIRSFETIKDLRIASASEELMEITTLCVSCYRQRK